MSTPLEQNTTKLAEILATVNALPDAGGSGGETCDVVVTVNPNQCHLFAYSVGEWSVYCRSWDMSLVESVTPGLVDATSSFADQFEYSFIVPKNGTFVVASQSELACTGNNITVNHMSLGSTDAPTNGSHLIIQVLDSGATATITAV